MDLDECRPELVVNTSNRLVFQLTSAALRLCRASPSDDSEPLH